MAIKSESSLRRELRKVNDLLRARRDDNSMERDMLYGAMQALEWAMGHDAAAPHTLVGEPTPSGLDSPETTATVGPD